MSCPECATKRQVRFDALCRSWSASSRPSVSQAGANLLVWVDDLYAKSLAKLCRALEGREPLPLWLMRKGPDRPIRVRFIIVDAPVSQVACCLKSPMNARGDALPCHACGHENRIVVFNLRFFVLCSHLLSRTGHGVPASTSFTRLFEALRCEHFDYQAWQAPHSVAREVVGAAIGVVLGHEFGHILRMDLPEVAFSDPGVPGAFQEHIRTELDADRQSIRILTASQASASPIDIDAPVRSFLGAELVWRTVALIERRSTGSAVDFEQLLPVCSKFYPSPLLRWQRQSEIGSIMGSLGLLNQQAWQDLSERTFTNWRGITDDDC